MCLKVMLCIIFFMLNFYSLPVFAENKIIMGYRTNARLPLINKAPDSSGLYLELYKIVTNSAKTVQRILEFGSYQTAWAWLHKLRRAVIRPGRERLSGIVEVDETFMGGEKPGKRGRGASGKTLVGIAVEDKGDEGIGRIRLGILSDASAQSLTTFATERIEPGSTIRSDKWGDYGGMVSAGYMRQVVKKTELKLAHLVASPLKR